MFKNNMIWIHIDDTHCLIGILLSPLVYGFHRRHGVFIQQPQTKIPKKFKV